MGNAGKSPDSDSAGDVRSPRTPAEKAPTWTREEMEEAAPYPMPEVPDDEAEASEATATRIVDVRVAHDRIVVDLSDGGAVSLPLHAFPRLLGATAVQRDGWHLIGAGIAVRWEALDEELSLATILARRPSGS